MDVGKLLSLKDFFNYYVAGSIWLLDFWIVLFLLPNPSNFSELQKTLTASNTVIQTIITIGITGLLPYSVGFLLSAIGDSITSVIHYVWGDPTKWLTDYTCGCYVGRRIPKYIINNAAYYASKLFRIDEKKFENNPRLYLFQMRAYVVNKTGGASDLATRALDLANFAESMIAPLSLLFALTSFWFLPSLNQALFGVASIELKYRLSISVAVLCAVSWLIAKRYLYLKETWIRHVYRGFVLLAESDMPERGKKAENVNSK